MFNTTLQDQVFQIPDSFLPLLNPGDPTSITIFGVGAGPRRQAPRERAPGRRDLHRRDDPGQHRDRRRPHARRLHPDRGRDRPDERLPAQHHRRGRRRRSRSSARSPARSTSPSSSATQRHRHRRPRLPDAATRSSIPGVQLNGVFMLELNTFSTTKSIQTFKIKQGRRTATSTASSTTLRATSWSRRRRSTSSAASSSSWPASWSSPTRCTSAPRSQFRIELAGADPGIELIVNGTMHSRPDRRHRRSSTAASGSTATASSPAFRSASSADFGSRDRPQVLASAACSR